MYTKTSFIVLLLGLSFVGFSQKSSIRDISKTYTDLDEAIKMREKVYHLNLSNQGLKEIPKEVLSLSNLKSLYLSDNQLSQIKIPLEKLEHLELLDLNGNEFKKIPVDQIKRCKSLKALNIRENEIKEVYSDLSQLIRLRALDLGQNKIAKISSEIKLPGIQFFRADQNELVDFPKAFANMGILREINLQGNLIEALDQEILSSLVKLRKLNLSYNPITDLSELKYCSKLTQLKINGIDLSKSDVYVICGLVKLKYLYTEDANLMELPSAIKNLKKLEEWYLSGNDISAVPEEISQLGKLRYVNLTGNPVSTLKLIQLQNDAPKAEIKI